MDGRELLVNRFDGSFAAETATGTGEYVAGQTFEVHGHARREKDVEGTARSIGVPAMGKLDHLTTLTDNAFRQKKAGGQFKVVTGRAHRDGDGFASDSDFERFLAGEGVPGARRVP